MNIVAIGSEPFEIAPLRGSSIRGFAEGPGPRLARRALDRALLECGTIDVLLSVGLCGALDPALRLNEVVAATRVNEIPVTPLSGLTPCALLSIDRFLGSPPEKDREFRKGFGAVEMEAAPLAEWAAANGVRFHAVKVVSDLAHEEFHLDFNRYRDRDGRFRKLPIALHGLLRPGDLFRMATRARPASAKLGEFLVQHAF